MVTLEDEITNWKKKKKYQICDFLFQCHLLEKDRVAISLDNLESGIIERHHVDWPERKPE